jgi:hypothetical protein
MKENFNYGNAVRSAQDWTLFNLLQFPNSTCYNGMDSYHYSKKDYDSLDTISATFIGLVNGYLRCIKNRNFGIILFFYNVVPWVSQENGGLCSCIIALDF